MNSWKFAISNYMLCPHGRETGPSIRLAEKILAFHLFTVVVIVQITKGSYIIRRNRYYFLNILKGSSPSPSFRPV